MRGVVRCVFGQALFRKEIVQFNEFLAPPDKRAATGYSALRAIDANGKVIWSKAYLVQTEGAYVGKANAVGARNVVETVPRVDFMLPGDKYFFLINSTDTELNFGSITFKVDFATGLPVGKVPRIKAVDTRELQEILDIAAVEVERHYSAKLTAETAQKKRSTSEFQWTGNYVTDLPEYLNTRIQQKWFPEFKK